MRLLHHCFVAVIPAVVFIYLTRIILFRTGLIFFTKKLWWAVETCFHVHQTFRVPQFVGDDRSGEANHLYGKVKTYLNALPSLEDSDFTNLFTASSRPNDIVLRLDPNRQIVVDDFLGAKLAWEYSEQVFVLRIRKADKRRILRPYLQHIHDVSDELESKGARELMLHVNHSHCAGGRWKSVRFRHPSTFDTITMEADLKGKIKSDLDSFIKGKQYYHRLGRLWKRSYLLYGSCGTGKSSFVSAMANFLRYDIYNVDLDCVTDDSDLKLLLMETRPKSMILIEDLDRFLISKEKSRDISLSGVLNFMDGVESCCAEERVMVITMSSKELVDPALLRPGRIDVHIHFPRCDFLAFKTLASSYLGVKEHKLFPQLEEIFQAGANLSPAEIGELMIANRNSPSRALKSVINALQTEADFQSRRRPVAELADGSDMSSKIRIQAVGKDIRKLYGLLRINSKASSETLDTSASVARVI